MNTAPVRITDAEDPRVAPYSSIRERDLVGRQGLFIAEGKVVLNVLFSARRFEPVSALVLDSRLDGVRETLGRAPEHMPVYVASQTVIDRIAGFHLHRGILALGRCADELSVDQLLRPLPTSALVVGLVGIGNHDNMGSIFRNAAAFDADAVVLDPQCCDPLYRKAIRVSVGAVLGMPYARADSTHSMLSLLEEAGFECIALTPRGPVDIAELKPGGRKALLLGTEGDGLPETVLKRSTAVRIPMSPSFDSLNVAAASAVAMHRLWRGG